MSFLIKGDEAWYKCDKIQDVVKNKLGINFHSKPVYDYRYSKAKLREFDGVIKTNYLVNDVPKENMHYTCIACITIDSVLKIDKKKSSAGAFRRMQIWGKKNTNVQIHKH